MGLLLLSAFVAIMFAQSRSLNALQGNVFNGLFSVQRFLVKYLTASRTIIYGT